MKKWLKILLWVIGIAFILIILGVLYFLFVFKIDMVNCLSSTNITESDIGCSSSAACYTYFKESQSGAIKSGLGQLSNSEETNLLVESLLQKASYCDTTCKLKNIYAPENENQVCNSGDEKFSIGVNGLKLLKIYLNGECATDLDCENSHPGEALVCKNKWCIAP
ncbi:MAG TPA: hypothetical protein VJK03_03495 [Candidatus Nanoarchaeia archaeon]|nr:hypothetical protein [Candidatus Nanoarchaeia archaeon]